MNNWLILSILIGIAIFGLLIGVVVYNKNKGQKIEPDYRVFFSLGIMWLPIGIATDNPGLWGMGAIFMILGLANRKKWKEEPKWSELSPERRRIRLIIIGGMTVLLLVGILAFILANQGGL